MLPDDDGDDCLFALHLYKVLTNSKILLEA